MLGPILFLGAAMATSPPVAPGSQIGLDGTSVAVEWSDGDSFTVRADGVGARLAGFNTLESYGPVHQWGEWTPRGLAAIARAATQFVRRRSWSCTRLPGSGGYGRIVVDCPDLREALLRAGLAHTFSVDGPAPAADLAAQSEAIAGQRGMWEKGVPAGIVTSLHSADEREDWTPYDRVCDTKTGHAPKHNHTDTYGVCQTVCHGGSCMVYVPYAQRYTDTPPACFSTGSVPTSAPAAPAKAEEPKPGQP